MLVGDRVQVIENAIDVTSGKISEYGKLYVEGSNVFGYVTSITKNWNTSNRYGLPNKITKITISSDTGIVVWQVAEDMVVPYVEPTEPPVEIGEDEFKDSNNKEVSNDQTSSVKEIPNDDEAIEYYGGIPNNIVWNGSNVKYSGKASGKRPGTTAPATDTGYISYIGLKDGYSYVPSTSRFEDSGYLNDKGMSATSAAIEQRNDILELRQPTAWQNENKRREMLNEDYENIQNSSEFPVYARESSGLIAAKYDYQIIPGDPRFKAMISLEDKLKQARAQLGIHVHGNNNIARSVKYYMYNRFKVPDTNLAFNRTVTYVFFTRPDLNYLVNGTSPGPNISGNSEMDLTYKRYPELFKLLTDCNRCNDSNNFNMLLSNQVSSFDLKDETLSNVIDAGKSWKGYSIKYGDHYSGREGGEFTCSFEETSELSIINLMKIWLTYIGNVADGTWSPSYNLHGTGVSEGLFDSHVYLKELDYAASAYVFKCAPDGETVLYWTKYFGIFPTNTGASALTWSKGNGVDGRPDVNITFAYSCKRDNSPTTLVEFNEIAGVEDDVLGENSYNPNYAGSSRPFVGTPFLVLENRNPVMKSGMVNHSSGRSLLKLKFKKLPNDALTDDLLYKFAITNKNVTMVEPKKKPPTVERLYSGGPVVENTESMFM